MKNLCEEYLKRRYFSEVVRNVVEMTSLEAGVVFKVVSKKVVLISSEGLEDKINGILKRNISG
jgi:hypothetical protein